MKLTYTSKALFLAASSLFLLTCGDNGEEFEQPDTAEESTEIPDENNDAANEEEEVNDDETTDDYSESGLLDEAVFENLELPGIHENTTAYGGRVNPGSTIEMEIYDRRGDIDSSSDIEVNEEGFFAVNLYQYESLEGDELTLNINHDELENEQVFILLRQKTPASISGSLLALIFLGL